MNITMNELQAVAPRVMLYVGLGYLAVRTVRFGINQIATLTGYNYGNKNDNN